MPTYDYCCDSCRHTFEKFQSMSAKVLRKCPKCGKSSLKRLIGSGSGIIFKGSGFYQTDYRSESYQKGKTAKAETKPSKEAVTSEAPKPAKESSTEKKSKDKSAK
jgi:putative FmdB family regulatory protein